MKSKITQKTIRRAKDKASKQCIENYNQLGVVYIPQALTTAEVDVLKKGIEFNLANLSHLSKIASKKSDKGLFVEDFCTWQTNPYYQEILFKSPLAPIASRLTGSQVIRLYHDHMLVKEPFTEQTTPWHQDQPYYNIDGAQNCSFWIPVDPVALESTLEFVAASHLGPWYIPRSFMNNEAKWFKAGSLDELPSNEAIRKNSKILGWEMQPGDIVAFHMLTLHGSAGVPINRRRRVFSARFIGDDITYAPREWATSPDFFELNNQLKEGSALDHALFPRIYQSNLKEVM